MNRISPARVPALACLLALAAFGCAGPGPGLNLGRVGPTSGARTGGLFAPPEGLLQVYSETVERNLGGILYYPHSDYSVYRMDGKKARGVGNSAGESDQTPAVVPLAPGDYTVYAAAAGYGLVKVQVSIVAGQITQVFLDRNGAPISAAIPPDAAVRLPDGTVIGRQATAPAPPPPAKPARAENPSPTPARPETAP